MSAEPDEITVLISDDSRLTRRALRVIFESRSGFRVVGEAGTGNEAIRLAKELGPHLITMDLDMPDGNGLTAIEEIMASCPTRILAITGAPRFDGVDATFGALSRGALELLAKPTAWPASDQETEQIITTARRLATVPVLLHPKAARERRQVERQQVSWKGRTDAALIAIGASTGGPRALRTIFGKLPSSFPRPIVVVQHLAEVFATGFFDWLDSNTALSVVEAVPGTRLKAGCVYVAVRGTHIGVSARGWLEAVHGPPRDGHCPSVDVLFESVAGMFGDRAIGVLLSGMGKDGAAGLRMLADAGGGTMAQDEASSTVYGMPKAAVELDAVKLILSCEDMAVALNRAVGAAPLEPQAT